MATIADNALITFDEYLEFEGKSKAETDLNENKFTVHINAVSQAIENECRRIVCPVTSKNELFSGDGDDYYLVRHKRITAAPTLYYWDGDSWVEMTTSEYPWSYDGDVGKIYFTQGGKFNEGTRYKITYSCGYARASVPSDLKLACYILAHRSTKRIEKEGVTSESFGDVTTSVNLTMMPDDVRAVINKYKAMFY